VIQGVGLHFSHHYVAKPSTSQTNLLFFVNNELYKRKPLIGGYWTGFVDAQSKQMIGHLLMNELKHVNSMSVCTDECTCKQMFVLNE